MKTKEAYWEQMLIDEAEEQMLVEQAEAEFNAKQLSEEDEKIKSFMVELAISLYKEFKK